MEIYSPADAVFGYGVWVVWQNGTLHWKYLQINGTLRDEFWIHKKIFEEEGTSATVVLFIAAILSISMLAFALVFVVYISKQIGNTPTRKQLEDAEAEVPLQVIEDSDHANNSDADQHGDR